MLDILQLLEFPTSLFEHWEQFVPKAARGQNLGTALVKAGLAFARENELVVVPVCPFVMAYMDKHTETQDLLA